MGPVHFPVTARVRQFHQHPYRIGRLVHLPALQLGLAAQFSLVGVHIGGGLLDKFPPRMGRNVVLRPDDQPAVEGWLSTRIPALFSEPGPEGTPPFLLG